MTESGRRAIAVLVRALKAADEAWLPALVDSCVALMDAAGKSSWNDVATKCADSLGQLSRLSVQSMASDEDKEAAVKAFCVSVKGPSATIDSAAVVQRLLKAAKQLVKPGELVDPDASRFWSTNFFTTTKAVPFGQFLDKFMRHVKELSIPDIERLEDGVSLEQLCLRPLRRIFIGNGTEMNPQQLQDVLDDSDAYAFPDTVLDALRRVCATAVPLDTAFARMIDRVTLEDPTFVKHQLRNYGCTLHNACKEPSARFEASLRDVMGISGKDAHTLAHAVFQEARPHLPIIVQTTSKIELARSAIEQLDDLVDMSCCELSLESARELFDMMRRTRHPKIVDLTSNNLHAEGAAAVATLIRELPRLEEIRLGGNMLQLSGIAQILEAAQDSSSLRALDLSCCHGQAEAGATVAKLLPGTSLSSFHFNGNDLGVVGCKALADGLARCPLLERLSLAANAAGDEGAAAVFAAVAVMPRLGRLSLRRNGLTDRAAIECAATLKKHASLRYVDLTDNAAVAADVFARLVEAASTNRSCEAVLLSGAGTDSQLRRVCEDNVAHMKRARAAILTTPVAKWTVDEACQWAHIVLGAPDLADLLRTCNINGLRLLTYTERAMERDGIRRADDRRRLMDSLELALRVAS